MSNSGASSSEDDDKDDSSGDISEDDSKLEEEAAALEKKVTDSPYEYDSYVELIKVLKKLGELDRLRQAREKMHKNFPMSPELWLSWLQDEVKLATSEEDRKAVTDLFERAVLDYVSVDVWLEYAQFSISDMGSDHGIEHVVSVFDRALTAVGLHVSKGALIWEAYREFENVLCSQKVVLGVTEDKGRGVYDRVLKLFKRQLSVPLLDMQNTYAEFQNWISEVGVEVDARDVERGYKKALDKLSLILPFEEMLLSCPTERRTPCYRRYITHEYETHGDPSRIQSLYERAISEETTPDSSFWLEYLDYLHDVLRVQSVVLETCKRAVRNCPWSSALWRHYLRILERTRAPHEEIKAVMEVALAAGFPMAQDYRELWVGYVDYLRRRVDFEATGREDRMEELVKCLSKAADYMTEYFGTTGDPNCVILQYWARVEAIHRKNMTEARLLWNRILSQGHDKCAATWLEYSELERWNTSDGKHLRRLYARALKSTQDWPETIGNAWLNYERDCGDLDQFEAALLAFNARMKEVTAQREKEAAEDEDHHQRWGSKERGNRSQDKGRRNQDKGRRNQDLKRKREDEGKWAASMPLTEFVKKTVVKVAESEEPAAKKVSKVAPPPGYKPSSEEEEAPAKKLKTEEQPNVPVVHDSSKDERTVFVSNLDFSITEDELRERFTSIGTLTDLRLVKDFKGRSKGFGYVEFSTREEACEALKRDRDPMKDRPMYISRCDPDKQTRKPVFKYSNSLEKNKLFIKGLPLAMTKDQLQDMYKEFGPMKEVRLVTYRNGHSKGMAYIDYEDSASAAKAVLKTDGLVIDEKTLTVAISQPPERRNQTSLISSSVVPSLGGGGDKEIGSRGRVKMAASLVPRSVQISSSKANGQSANGENKPSEQDSKKPLNNQDFRQMLLGDKK